LSNQNNNTRAHTHKTIPNKKNETRDAAIDADADDETDVPMRRCSQRNQSPDLIFHEPIHASCIGSKRFFSFTESASTSSGEKMDWEVRNGKLEVDSMEKAVQQH